MSQRPPDENKSSLRGSPLAISLRLRKCSIATMVQDCEFAKVPGCDRIYSEPRLPMLVPDVAAIPAAVPKSRRHRTRQLLLRAWGRVRWKMVAIVAFTGTSTILIACLAVAALNVMVRRESANVVEKQIQMLVEASRSVAPAILDHVDACTVPASDFGSLKPLLAYIDEAFPEGRASLTVEDKRGVRSLLPGPELKGAKSPDWLPETGFTGLVVDQGQLQIRNLVTQQKRACKVTAIFSLPLGSELAKRLSSAAGLEVMTLSPRPFRVPRSGNRSLRLHAPNQRILRTIESNFMPGISRPTAVVLSVRNWETGAREDWIAYTVRASYWGTFEDVARFGSQLGNWVWLLAVISFTVLLLDAAGLWMCIRFGRDIAITIDNLSRAARQIASGNFAWRSPLSSKGQLGDLICNFNEMAIALERFQKDEAARLRLESELQVARSVQGYLYPRVVPPLRGATVSGRTLAARMIGGDLYDFFNLGQERIGILCADVSGKGIPAALMMANLQAVARTHLSERIDSPAAHFVQALNQQLTGRFGDNRYASLFWADYNEHAAVLTYVNAGHPPPILICSTGEIERLDSGDFPVGMFSHAQYTARTIQMQPGSRLVIFTDGLTDAENTKEQEFGDERLIACCRAIAAGIGATEVADRVMQAIAEWSVGTEQFDDTTVVVMDVAR
jgi:serine phosphatase RsbU (regulator of sigma subunit)